ncbi:MAG TPA: glycoside hydrolase family 36 N-terminal domain-containing protein [Pyrinomonadaceae bacterium]|nr:glycoside hydrolase family 36 N-terminal domain-containing protein [Pyrinomonadaceae bacterium]
MLGARAASAQARAEPRVINVSTAGSSLTLLAAGDGRLYQLGYGRPKQSAVRPSRTPAREDEFYPQAGHGFVLEPAVQAVHADGNTSTDLVYVSHETAAVDDNVTHTRVSLKDGHYPFFVTLHLRSYRREDVIEQWAEIRHEEDGPVTLSRFASSSPVLKADAYWLTQLQGNYMREAELVEERLTPGLKILDSKLGVRAHQMRNPSFLLSTEGPAREESGEVYGGTLAWSGSFQFAFEVDWTGRLRALAGINPFGSEY